MFAAQHLSSSQATPARIYRTTALLCAGLLTVAASILIASPAYAAPVGPDAAGISYETDPSDNTAAVTDYTQVGTDTDVVIPDTITDGGDTYTITSIGNGAFENDGLTSVTIPNTVTTIGNDAFRNNDLITVTIGDSITTIGDRVFASNALTTVTIPNTVTTIGDFAFTNNALTTVTIGNSVTTIGDFAFGINPGLNSAVFQGPPPSTFTPKAPSGSLGDNLVLIVYYPSQFANDYDPGNTEDLWQGYASMVGATLNYDLGGHSTAIDGITVIPGTAAPTVAAPPADPTEPDYTFEGWYTTATGTTPFDFTAPLTGDTTAFAQWAAVTAAILPATGTTLAPMVGTGILALLLGGMLLAWTRRLRRA